MIIKKLGDRKTKIVLEKTNSHTNSAVLFIPGASGEVFNSKFDSLSQSCREKGLDFLRVQIWKNMEELERKNIRTIHHDIDSAVSYLKKNGYKKIMGIGKSLGGTALLTRNHPDISKLALWAPIIGISKTKGNIEKKMDAEFAKITSLLEITVDKEMLSLLKIPILIVSGNKDQLMPLANTSQLLHLLPSAKLVQIKGMGHSYKTPRQE